MTDPTMAWARNFKRLVSQHLELEARMGIQVAWEAGYLKGIPTKELGVRIVSRDPDRKGYEGVGAAWRDVADSLTLLENQQLIDKKSAADVVRVVIGSYGFDIDPKLLEDQLQSQSQGQGQAQGQDQAKGQVQGKGQKKVNSGGKGIMNSNNPLDSVLNEAFDSLERAKKEGLDLLRQF